jgi:CRISPR-associated protein (TIGR02710 family)
MSLGLEKAAHVLGLKTIYIQSEYERLPDGRSAVVPGSQRLVIPPDPYLVFGDLEAAEARRQFQQYNYTVAAQLFGGLAARVPEPHCRRYAAAAALAQAYADWEVLSFDEARAHLGVLLAMPPGDLVEIAAYRSVLEQQHAALGQLHVIAQSVARHDTDALQTLADADAMLWLIGTLHSAALRRAAQGRYDFAALFRYRCLELVGQHRLAAHGLLAGRPDYKALPMPKAELSLAYQEQQRAIGRKQPRGAPDRIALFDGYLLLAALDDPLVRGYEILRIEARSNARNQSVLAHGYRLIGRSEYEQFADVVDEIIDSLFTHVLERSRSDWEQVVRFVDPFGA